jgi:hypothetical protein
MGCSNQSGAIFAWFGEETLWTRIQKLGGKKRRLRPHAAASDSAAAPRKETKTRNRMEIWTGKAVRTSIRESYWVGPGFGYQFSS